MARPINMRQELKTLGRLLSQADMTLDTIPDPHPAIARSRELLGTATKLAANLAVMTPAAAAPRVDAKTAERRPLSSKLPGGRSNNR